MKNILSIFFLLCCTFFVNAQITLTHNIGTTLIDTGMPSCEDDESWARIFNLPDFGIDKSHQFIIRSAEIGINKSYNGAYIGLAVYSIDSDFPNSTPIPVGGGGYGLLPNIDTPQVVQINLVNPIVVPAGVERILVEVVKNEDFYNPNSAEVIIAGTEFDNDISWYKGCRQYYSYSPTTDLNVPVPNANFYINVTGEPLNTNNTTLTHNLNDPPIWMNQYGCTDGGLKFARTFVLEDFGISTNEEFTINSGQVAFSSVGVWNVKIQFNIYKIDANFPDSYSDDDLVGSSQIVNLPYFGSGNPRIFNVDFETPIVIPSNVRMILVEVYNLAGSGVAFIAGTEQNNDISWLKSENGGCPPECYTSTIKMGKPEVNYYIKVSGDRNQVSNNFGMSITNICTEFLKEFSVEPKSNVNSVVWDFGDAASGTNNISTDLSPFHDFSSNGTYTITATVTANDGSVEILVETINVKEPVNAYGISNVYACEDIFNTGFSTSFDVALVEQQVLNNQTDKIVTYIDGAGNRYNTLPNPFANTIKDRETITVRVANRDNHCCYSETTFDLIVNPKPSIESVEDLIVCEGETNGFALFDLKQLETNIIGTETNIQVEFYHENGQQIQEPLNAVENLVVNEEVVTVRKNNTDTECYNETTFKLIVTPLPIANNLNELIGCDDNNDGISEYFDTSNVEIEVLGDQTNMEVSYFDTNGNQLSSPLPNPYTNTISNQEIITVRVTNQLTSCYAETPLLLKTTSQPQINKPQTIYSCDLGDGFSIFDTSNVESQLIGNQSGLKILYFDVNENQLESPLPAAFENTQAWSQTILVKVENQLNSLCYSETSFDLIVNKLPMVVIDDSYFLCDLEPSLYVSVEHGFDGYKWEYQDGNIISTTYETNLVDAGNYILTIGENKNGVYCENSFNFKLIRSTLPTISEVEYKELSDENFIRIIASGDGDFEYSIDGINYQNSNVFDNVLGGVYTVSVRDKLGCGGDSRTITIIDYPKYFTPNGDGINDTWQIKGIADYPNAIIYIYDRYGKLLKQIRSNSSGWDGTFNGEEMISSDYWFTVNLDGSREFKGHFSLKR